MIHFSNTNRYRRLVNSVMVGSTQVHIRNGDFLQIPIYTPVQKSEQQKVADCLSSVDELISAETQKIEALKAHKKGLMQQLFPTKDATVPKLRFPDFIDDGEWKEYELGNKKIAEFVKDKTPIDKLVIESYISTKNLLPDYAGIKTASSLPPSGLFTKFIKNDIKNDILI